MTKEVWRKPTGETDGKKEPEGSARAGTRERVRGEGGVRTEKDR